MSDLALREEVAARLERRCASLHGHGDGQELSALDDLITHLGDATEPRMHASATCALSRKALLLARAERFDEAVVLGDAVVARLDDVNDASVLAEVGEMLLLMATELSRHARLEELLTTMQGLIDRFRRADDAKLRELLVHALRRTQIALVQLGRIDESNVAWEELLGLGDEAIAAFDKVVERSEHRAEPELRQRLASALFAKASLLGEMHRRDEAIAVVTELIARFEHDESPTGQGAVAMAYGLLARLPEDLPA